MYKFVLIKVSSKLNLSKMDSENLNLILEMAKTASLLSSQLLQLHKNLSINSTPKTKFLNHLTPISSGYNSVKTSCENLSIFSHKKYPINHDMTSLIFNSTSSDMESNNGSRFSSSFIEMETQSIKKCLFLEETTPFSERHNFLASSQILRTTTPFKKVEPAIPRIKEVRKEVCKKKSNEIFNSKNKRKVFKCLNMSSSSM